MLLEVNDSAKEILKCLNGTMPEKDIIGFISRKYKENYSVAKVLVNSFLENIKENMLVEIVDTPDFVTLDLTHNCHLNCAHCFVNARIGKSTPAEECFSLVNKLVDMGGYYFSINWWITFFIFTY